MDTLTVGYGRTLRALGHVLAKHQSANCVNDPRLWQLRRQFYALPARAVL